MYTQPAFCFILIIIITDGYPTSQHTPYKHKRDLTTEELVLQPQLLVVVDKYNFSSSVSQVTTLDVTLNLNFCENITKHYPLPALEILCKNLSSSLIDKLSEVCTQHFGPKQETGSRSPKQFVFGPMLLSHMYLAFNNKTANTKKDFVRIVDEVTKKMKMFAENLIKDVTLFGIGENPTFLTKVLPQYYQEKIGIPLGCKMQESDQLEKVSFHFFAKI